MMEGLLTDKERVDAWELGIQVAQLQARGIRELHHVVHSVQEECRKQVHLLSEKIMQIQMDNNDKLQSVSAQAPCHVRVWVRAVGRPCSHRGETCTADVWREQDRTRGAGDRAGQAKGAGGG